MKKALLLLLFILFFVPVCRCFAQDGAELRDYDGIQLAKGTFIPVISAQEISTALCDVGTVVKFMSTTDLYLYETKLIPQDTEFFGYIEKINEPVVGTNASMVIKISKLRFIDGFELPVNGYIYANNSKLIGGELTAPASYDKKASYRQNYYTMVGYAPGATRKMGEPTVITSGANLLVVLEAPIYITHTVNN